MYICPFLEIKTNFAIWKVYSKYSENYKTLELEDDILDLIFHSPINIRHSAIVPWKLLLKSRLPIPQFSGSPCTTNI